MRRFWQKDRPAQHIALEPVTREPDPEVIAAVERARQDMEHITRIAPDIHAIAQTLRAEREHNHFADLIAASMSSRRKGQRES